MVNIVDFEYTDMGEVGDRLWFYYMIDDSPVVYNEGLRTFMQGVILHWREDHIISKILLKTEIEW